MREQTKVFIEMLAKRRSEGLKGADPTIEAVLAMDDSGLRGALQIFKDGELDHLEFIESEATAGQVRYFDDYIEVARSVGKLVLLFPESRFSRDMASAVYQSIMKEVLKDSEREVIFQGFVYNGVGNVKKVD